MTNSLRISGILSMTVSIAVWAVGCGNQEQPFRDSQTIGSTQRCGPLGSGLDFNSAMINSMEKMDRDMMTAPMSGDPGHDFSAMMIPHHQGAIDMAVAVLRYGRNAQIRRLAQEIIVTQQQEIAAMRLAVGQPLPSSLPAPTQPSPGASDANAHD